MERAVDDAWLGSLAPNGTQCRCLTGALVGGRTKVEVRGVQKPRATVGGGSPNALLDANTLRGSL